MFHALSTAAVLVAAAIALMATLGAWRRRSATPRTASLAAACAACVGLALTAIDEPMTAQWLCTERRLPPDATEPPSDTTEPLDERLRGVLAQWSWWVRPCGRLDVTVAEADLVTPIHLGELVDLASRTRVAVDVRLPTGMPSPGEALVLTMRREADKPLVLPTTTPIPLSYADMVEVRLAESLAECQIDDGSFSQGRLAHLLADAALSKDDRLGFHRLRCKRGDAPDSFVSAYVQIVSTGVVFASSDEGFVVQQRRDIGQTDACATPAACIGLRPERTRSPALEVPTVVPEEEAPNTASMLVLDRPRTARSCDLAHRLLNLGATVVVAMPEDGFFSAKCEQWFPVARKSGAEGWVFDRTPRLTFVFDEGFEAGLDSTPSAVIEATDPCGPITKLHGSLGDQRRVADGLCEAAKRVAPDVRCSSWGHAAGVDRRFPEPAAQDDGRGDCTAGGDPERLACSAPDGATERFAAELFVRRESWENEVLVVFTHDHRPFELLGAALASRTQVVRIDDPYGFSLSRVYHQPAIADLPLTPEIVVDAEARALSDVKGAEEVRCDLRSVPDLDERRLEVFSAARQAQAEFTLGAEEATRFPRRHERATTPAPMRLGWWDQPGAPRGSRIEDATVELAKMPRAEGIVERTLAVGAMVGPGHLLFLAYSPFAERRQDSSRVLDGMRMIEDIYDTTEDFIGKIHSEVLSVTPRPDGALWIAVARDIDGAAPDVDGLRVQSSDGREFVAPLVDLAHDRGILTYALPAAELEKLERCFSIALPPVGGPSSRSTSAIWACPPDARVDEGGRMAAVVALQQLAHFSGGRVLGPDDHVTRTSLRTRNFGLGLLTLSFLFAWSRRAARRLGGVGTARRLSRHERVAQRRYDPPDAVVAAAGDWDGRSTTWSRTGSFGGYRPIEPGDRAGAAVLADLLVRQLRGTELLPRVALRIEESAPAVVVLVNLGASMRTGGANGSGKATFGGRVALHVAASAWKIRGEVTIVAAGVEGESEVVAACRLGPDDEEVAQVLQRRLGQPAARHATPWPAELPECGALVYVSDYQHEDEEALHRWLVRLEAVGVRVGGVMIYSPQEFAMVEGGRLAGSGVWVDRADWEPDDVFAAFGRRRDQIERIFDGATTGGLVVAATTYHPDDLEQALVGGRLLEILR